MRGFLSRFYNNTSGKPKINIDFKMDTADIAKMNDGQRKATGMFIDKLQGEDTKEK